MTKLNELHSEWLKEPAYKSSYQSLEDEFALASALIEARSAAHMTQAQVARLESGRSRPSTRTLHRYAQATGMRLRISFEPDRSEAAAHVESR